MSIGCDSRSSLGRSGVLGAHSWEGKGWPERGQPPPGPLSRLGKGGFAICEFWRRGRKVCSSGGRGARRRLAKILASGAVHSQHAQDVDDGLLNDDARKAVPAV